MLVEFRRTGAPEEVVGTASWEGGAVEIGAEADDVRAALAKVFRPTPVVVDDGAYRRLGAHGESVLQPGSLAWFRAAALTRAAEVGLSARIVPGVTGGGWDPAAQYRTFSDAIDRLG